MRRVCTLVGMTVVALAARASVAHATTTGETKNGEVKSLAVVSASGRAEVVIPSAFRTSLWPTRRASSSI
jgi:hypothetical protein